MDWKRITNFINGKDIGGTGGFGASSFITRWLLPDTASRDYFSYYRGYVYACVSAIAEEVGMIDFKMNRVLQSGDTAEVATHSFLNLLANPNPLMSKYQLIEMTQTHIELMGEAFWYMELGELTGKPKSIYMLNPQKMEIMWQEGASVPSIAGWKYHRDDGVKVPLDKEEIVHFKMPNPFNPYRGLGTVEAGLAYVMTEKYGAEYTRNFLYNNAMPAGIVNVGKTKTVGPEAFNEFKRQFKQEYGSINNAGKLAFVRNMEIDLTKVGSNLSEIALKELKDMSRDDIMTMFRVSKPILGIFEDVNLASAKTAQYVFMSRVINPKMMRLIDTLQYVVDRYNTPNIAYKLDYESPVPEDEAAKLELYKAALAGDSGWMTINEVRTLEGLEEIEEGGDEVRRSNTSGQLMMAPKRFKNGKLIKRTTVTQKTLTAEEQQQEKYQRKENFRLQLFKQQEAYVGRFQKAVTKVLNDQLKEVKRNITPNKAFDDLMFDDEKSKKAFVATLTPVVVELLKEQGKTALDFVGDNETTFDITPGVMREIERNILRWASNFDDQTKSDLIKTFQEGYLEGDSIAKLTKRVESIYSDAKGYRAERIARTETIKASNEAALEAYRQSPVVVGKQWLAEPDACEFCEAMNGQVLSLDAPFAEVGTEIVGKDGGVYQVDYESVETADLHPNCKCTIVPITD